MPSIIKSTDPLSKILEIQCLMRTKILKQKDITTECKTLKTLLEMKELLLPNNFAIFSFYNDLIKMLIGLEQLHLYREVKDLIGPSQLLFVDYLNKFSDRVRNGFEVLYINKELQEISDHSQLLARDFEGN